MGKELLEQKHAYQGVCTFYSETGTEGGYWAFQDEKFIGIPDDTENCARCGYCRDYIEKRQPGTPIQVISFQPLLGALAGKNLNACLPGEHMWQLVSPDGRWSYEGLHVLKNGDLLTIYSPEKPEEIVWSGVILLEQFSLFTQESFGCWIHSDQIGIERETWAKWFFEEYPGQLITKDERR